MSEDSDGHDTFSLLALREDMETREAIAGLRIRDYGRYHFVFGLAGCDFPQEKETM